MITLGDGTVELQEWKVERLADDTFEFHAYVGHNYNQNGSKRLSAGAIWMIMKLEDPGSINETMEYRMGRTGLPGSGNDTLLTEWAGRAASTFYRYDEIMQQFFNG